MKILLPIFILIFAVGISAQVKKTTKTSKPVKTSASSDVVIFNDLVKKKRDAEAQRKQLSIKYTDDYPQIIQLTSEINKLTKQITDFAATHNVPYVLETLPDDTTILLKMLIIQNQQIIELLKQKPRAQ